MAGHAKTLNPRQVAFCALLVPPDGAAPMSYADAYRKAGYKVTDGSARAATALAQLPIVKTELARLQDIARATVSLTAAHWTREVLYQYQRYRDSDPNAAQASLDKWAKHLGLYEKTDANTAQSAQILAGLAALVGQQRANPSQDQQPAIGAFGAPQVGPWQVLPEPPGP